MLSLLEIMLFVILIIKLIFLYAIIRVRVGKKKGANKKTLEKFENLEGITHKLFFMSMSVLMMYLFQPHAFHPKPVVVSGETKTFLFLFALLTVIGIDYIEFYQQMKKYIGSFN